MNPAPLIADLLAAPPPDRAAGAPPRARRHHTVRRHSDACERVARYIDEHFAEPVTARRLAGVGLLSEFHLQRSFAALTGHGMAAQLRRRRLERAMHLLVSRSALSLDTVARESGLSCASALIHLFRRELGTTPGRFRTLAEQTHSLPRPPAGAAAVPAGRGIEPARLVTLAPREILVFTVFGSSSRHFAQVGFDAADRFERVLHGLRGAPPAWPMLSVYPDPALGPADPTQRLLLATEIGDGARCGDAELRAHGLRRATLPGGCYLVVPYAGAHQHTWMAWSRIRHGGPLAPPAADARLHAPVFEYVAATAGEGAARQRLGVTLWLPVHDPADTPAARFDRDGEDRLLLARLAGPPASLAERLVLQRA